MHIVTCSNCLDLKRIVALRRGVNEKRFFFCKFSHKFSCKLSILLVQNISVLDKLVSCIRVDYENKTQTLSIQFFIDSIQFNSIQFNSIQFNSIQFNSIQFNSIQFNSIQFNSIQFFTDAQAVLLIGMKGMHYAQLKC